MLDAKMVSEPSRSPNHWSPSQITRHVTTHPRGWSGLGQTILSIPFPRIATRESPRGSSPMSFDTHGIPRFLQSRLASRVWRLLLYRYPHCATIITVITCILSPWVINMSVYTLILTRSGPLSGPQCRGLIYPPEAHDESPCTPRSVSHAHALPRSKSPLVLILAYEHTTYFCFIVYTRLRKSKSASFGIRRNRIHTHPDYSKSGKQRI